MVGTRLIVDFSTEAFFVLFFEACSVLSSLDSDFLLSVSGPWSQTSQSFPFVFAVNHSSKSMRVRFAGYSL